MTDISEMEVNLIGMKIKILYFINIILLNN
jgi:hypothetical protein